MEKQEKTQKSKINFWPYIILSMIIGTIIACIWTIKIAMDNPVEMDSFYFDKYQEVDHKYNEIEASQKLFENNFKISFVNTKEVYVNQVLPIQILLIGIGPYETKNIKAKVLLTRPHTNKQNQEIEVMIKDDFFDLSALKPDSIGTWQILAKIDTGDSVGFFKETFVVK